MNLLLDKVRSNMIELTNQYIEDAAHDIFHLDRVYNMAKHINKSLNYKADEDILCIASYLHDLHRFKTNDIYQLKSSDSTNDILIDIYTKLNLPVDKFNLVKLCIESTDKHSFSTDISIDKELPIEAKILNDADNLDSLGAIGIARTFTFGQYVNEPIYIPDVDLHIEKYDITKKDRKSVGSVDFS